MTQPGNKDFNLAAGIQRAPWIALVLALLVFFSGYRSDIGAERELVDAERTIALDRIESSLTRDLNHQVDLLVSINALFGASAEVTRTEFQMFLEISRTFERNPGLLAVEWVPLVQPDQLVVTYVEPLAGNEQALGFDLSSSPVRLDAIQLARETGDVVGTGPIELVRQADSMLGLLFVNPVFDTASPNEEDGFAGVTITVFDIERLVANISGDLPPYVLSDLGSVGSPEEAERTFIFDTDDSTVPSAVDRSFQIAGRQWEIALGEGAIDPPSKLSIFLRLLPQLITIFAVISVLGLLSRKSRISQEHAMALTSEVRQKNRELVRSNEWLESFTRVASHDLRSPLRAVTSLVGFIREDNPDLEESATFNLTRIEQRVDRMNVLIDDLLTLARISDASEKPAEVEFRSVVDEVLSTVDIPQGFTVETTFSGRESAALAPVQFRTCVQNLVDNAIKHHDEGVGVVKIDVLATDDEVEIVVADDGPGIPAQYLESVFEPFRRLKPDDDSPGSGIGLTAILRTTENNNGTISVDSEDGTGTTFTLRWPLGETSV